MKLARFMLVVVCSCLPSDPAVAQLVTLRKTFTVEVPARGLRPTKRELNEELKFPAGFEVKRDPAPHGAAEVEKKRDGLDQEEFRFDPVDGGVRVIWKLRNEVPIPKTASLTIELKAEPNTPPSLSRKYEAIRQHFLDTFYHQGRIACWVSKEPGQAIKFGDQTIDMGHALMVFSTEMAIRRKLGQATDEPKKLILEILDAFDELDKKAEGRYGAPEQPLNGFFVRDDIQGKDDPRIKPKYATVKSDWQNPPDASPSGDQVFGMMYGLICVVRYSGDAALQDRAKAISRRLFDYAKRNKFILRLPDGKPNDRGEDLRWLSSLLHGLNQHITGDDLFGDCRIDGPLPNMRLNAIGDFWAMKAIHKLMPKVFNRDLAELLPSPLRHFVPKEKDGIPLKLNSFAIHILLMAMAPSDIMTQEDFEAAALKAEHHAAVLWSAKLHGRLPQGVGPADIAKILDLCPDSGPHGGLAADTGWNKDNRWVRCTNIREAPANDRLHNGLDWLLLHNLNELVFRGADSGVGATQQFGTEQPRVGMRKLGMRPLALPSLADQKNP